MKKNDKTLPEMLFIMAVWGILVQIVLLVGFQGDVYNAIGLWSGIAVAGGMAIHMKRAIEDALDLGGEAMAKKLRADSIKRMAVAGIVIAIVFYFKLGNPLTVLLGIFALKISAYAQPVVHKIFQKWRKGG